VAITQWISPETLISQVHNTAPFLERRFPAVEAGRLVSLGDTPEGFLRILASWQNLIADALSSEEQLQDYFALCLACHHATVATFVPTDVDAKIRGVLWQETRDTGVLRPMLKLALQARGWTLEGISTRVVRGVSGHDGEHWSVIAGALGRFLELGDAEAAGEAQAAIEQEIEREESVFNETAREPGAEIDLLKLAMSMAHNRGDLSQGVSFWKKTAATVRVSEHLSHLGKFALAVKIYQETGMSAEGHRHYPLRHVKALRQSPDTLLPLSPFLDDWGAAVMRIEEHHEVMEALLSGCKKIAGQQGYYRALAGMRGTNPGQFDRSSRNMSNLAQRYLREASTRKLMDVSRGSFESTMRKRARTALGW
jgi:hypothetical protein